VPDYCSHFATFSAFLGQLRGTVQAEIEAYVGFSHVNDEFEIGLLHVLDTGSEVKPSRDHDSDT
jgi:hypothetical protein